MLILVSSKCENLILFGDCRFYLIFVLGLDYKGFVPVFLLISLNFIRLMALGYIEIKFLVNTL